MRTDVGVGAQWFMEGPLLGQVLAEPRCDDPHLLFRDRAVTPRAVGQDSVDLVVTAWQASELEHGREIGWGLVA